MSFRRHARVATPSIALAAAISSLALAGCGEEDDGGPCTYRSSPVTATITSVTTATAEACSSLCPPGINVVADITDADGTVLRSDFPLASNVPQLWIDAQGWAVGDTVDGTYEEITSGTCDPDIYTWQDGDEGAFERDATATCVAALASDDGPTIDACPDLDCHDVTTLEGARCTFTDPCTYDEFVEGPRTWACTAGTFTEQ